MHKTGILVQKLTAPCRTLSAIVNIDKLINEFISVVLTDV